jgi:hypothetical protein
VTSWLQALDHHNHPAIAMAPSTKAQWAQPPSQEELERRNVSFNFYSKTTGNHFKD